MGFTNVTCYHTVDKNVNNGRNAHCHFIEHNRRNKTQSQLMTELFYPLCSELELYFNIYLSSYLVYLYI